MVKSVQLLQCQAFGNKMLLFSPQTPRCSYPFCFSTVLKGDLILSPFEEGSFCCTESISSNGAICQPVELDCVSHMGLEAELVLAHPCPVKGENVLTESCIPALFSYLWSHCLVFQTPIIPEPFLLEILFRANPFTLTLRMPQKTLSEAVCMPKWAVKKQNFIFCKVQL